MHPSGRDDVGATSLLLIALSGILAGCAARHAAPDARRLEELAGQASLIFRGTVVKAAASSVRAVPAGPDTAVVRVDEVLRGEETLGGLIAQQVTVRLRVPGSVSPRQHAAFFANPEVFGENLAVREVDHLAAAETRADLGKSVVEAGRRQADQALRQRLAQAQAVVVGVVSSARPLAEELRPPRSEHDPDWWRAELKAEAVVKGQLLAGEVAVHFAHSRDVVWFRSPKLQERQRGVFLLQRSEAAGLPPGSYALLDPLDLQPLEERPRIERLLRTIR